MTIIQAKTFGGIASDPQANNYKLQGTVIGHDGNPKRSKIAVFVELSSVGGQAAPPGFRQFQIIRTDPSGKYKILNLSPQKHTLIAYDNTGQYDPVIKGGLIPEPME